MKHKKYFRIFYYEKGYETLPVRSDLCITARDKQSAMINAKEKMGNDFKVIKIESEKNPTNILSTIIITVLLLTSLCNAGQYKVIENIHYGKPLEPYYLVEDNSTTFPIYKQESIRYINRSGSISYRMKDTKIGEIYGRWNVLSLQKIISNINYKLLTATEKEKVPLLQRKSELESILSTVEAEILHSEQLRK